MARLILTEAGEDVEVGGNVTVYGTRSGGEVITVYGGIIVLDGSFNAGGDTVKLPDTAASYTIQLLGSAAVLVSPTLTITIPIGRAGLQVAFSDGSRTLLFDASMGAVRLGDQIFGEVTVQVAPTGPAPTQVGTELADTINGTVGNDVIDGRGGNDYINAAAGNDVVRGGVGDDTIFGSLGYDQLFGDAGADSIYDDEGTQSHMDGGSGDDRLSIAGSQMTSFQMIGGDGNDFISVFVSSAGSGTIDAGPGDDYLSIGTERMPLNITLGAGRDHLLLSQYALFTGVFAVLTVSDFETGASGDKVSLTVALGEYLRNWDQATNPFVTGHLRLVDRLGSAVLQIDQDGPNGAAQFKDLIIFSGDTKASFTTDNFAGYNPNPPTATTSGAAAHDSQSAHLDQGADQIAYMPMDYADRGAAMFGYHLIA